ncbi:hypothetical protein OHB06_06885 [Streptomyces sp. NBC_01604]|uniref:hypothetical protein n=1 Tax=Streptomyces sp. NBC_01604 TaxID=2975894 RepID=UPI00386C8C7C
MAGRNDAGIDDRAQMLRANFRTAGVTFAELTLNLALAIHQVVRGAHDQAAAMIARLRENTHSGDYACYSDIDHFRIGLPVEVASSALAITEHAQATNPFTSDLILVFPGLSSMQNQATVAVRSAPDGRFQRSVVSTKSARERWRRVTTCAFSQHRTSTGVGTPSSNHPE